MISLVLREAAVRRRRIDNGVPASNVTMPNGLRQAAERGSCRTPFNMAMPAIELLPHCISSVAGPRCRFGGSRASGAHEITDEQDHQGAAIDRP